MLFKVLHITYTILHLVAQCIEMQQEETEVEKKEEERRKGSEMHRLCMYIKHYMRLEGNTHMHTCPVLPPE